MPAFSPGLSVATSSIDDTRLGSLGIALFDVADRHADAAAPLSISSARTLGVTRVWPRTGGREDAGYCDRRHGDRDDGGGFPRLHDWSPRRGTAAGADRRDAP
jgi:hypothetical protein